MTSIIIPTYNRFSLLVQAVESCLNQTYQDIEIIIIDDGSTDGTEAGVSNLLNNEWKNKPIIFHKQKNAGASAARNKGLELSKGEYIQFLDSDDLLFPEKIDLQLKAIKKNDADGCSCLGIMGETPENATSILGETFDEVRNLLHRMCSGRVHVMCTPAPLWKKTVLMKTLGWNTNIAFGDDLEFHIRVLMNVEKIAFVDRKLFFVREHTDNRLSDASNNIKQIESGILTQQLIAETIRKNEIWDKDFQTGILKNARTLYANYLQLAAKGELRKFEKWIINIVTKPIFRMDMLSLVVCRRLFGAKAILNFYRRISK